jgi:hypothetical protein
VAQTPGAAPDDGRGRPEHTSEQPEVNEIDIRDAQGDLAERTMPWFNT